MQLTRLMDTYSRVLDWAGDRVEVHGVVADLRQVQPGYLFVAIPDAGVDDCNMISEALKGGAVAIAGERPAEELYDLPWGHFHLRAGPGRASCLAPALRFLVTRP